MSTYTDSTADHFGIPSYVRNMLTTTPTTNAHKLEFTTDELVFLIEKLQVTRVAFHKRTGAVSISNKMCMDEPLHALVNKVHHAVQEVQKENKLIESIVNKLECGQNVVANSKRKFVILEENE